MPGLEQPTDLVGTTLGAYRITARIGAGGMGVVYRADQAPLGRPVALKVIHDHLAQDPGVAARFLREAKIASSLRNPNTTTVYDFGQSPDGRLYMAMEMLEGESLAARLKRKRFLEPAEVVEIGLQVCRSLAEAHGKAIVHRDLKSDNVFLTTADDGSLLVKVLDYGIARAGAQSAVTGSAPGTLTKHGTLLGTPAYMAPEQARGETIDGRTDLWALGVVLYEALTGVCPFGGENPVVILGKLLSEPHPPMAKVGRRVRPPEALEALVDALLSKDPAERPETALAVQARLRAFAGGTASSGGKSAEPAPRDSSIGSWELPLELATPVPPATPIASEPTLAAPTGTPPASATPAPIPPTRGATPSPLDPPASPPSDPRRSSVPPAQARPSTPPARSSTPPARSSTPPPRPSTPPPRSSVVPSAPASADPFERELSSEGPSLEVDRGPRYTPDMPSAVARRSSIPPRPRVSRPPPPPPSGGAGIIVLFGLLAAAGTGGWLYFRPRLQAAASGRDAVSVADAAAAPTATPDGAVEPEPPASQVALTEREQALRDNGWEPAQLAAGRWAGTYDLEGGTLRLFEEGGRLTGSFEEALRSGGLQGEVQSDGSLAFSWRLGAGGAVRGTDARTGRGVLRAWTRRRQTQLLGTWGYGDSAEGVVWAATSRGPAPAKRPRR